MGESSGSWSVVAHMVANDGNNEGLFSSAIGLSGGPLKVEGPSRQQQMFDDLVSPTKFALQAASTLQSPSLTKRPPVRIRWVRPSR